MGDLNRDGKTDLVVPTGAGLPTDTVSIFLSKGEDDSTTGLPAFRYASICSVWASGNVRHRVKVTTRSGSAGVFPARYVVAYVRIEDVRFGSRANSTVARTPLSTIESC